MITNIEISKNKEFGKTDYEVAHSLLCMVGVVDNGTGICPKPRVKR